MRSWSSERDNVRASLPEGGVKGYKQLGIETCAVLAVVQVLPAEDTSPVSPCFNLSSPSFNYARPSSWIARVQHPVARGQPPIHIPEQYLHILCFF